MQRGERTSGQIHGLGLGKRSIFDDYFGRERVRHRIASGATRAGRIALGGAASRETGHDVSMLQALCDLHDRAGDEQRRLLEKYPGTLPKPLRGDLEYYDGAQFYKLHISRTLEAEGRRSILTPDQHVWFVSTNGMNDWWMDESTRVSESDTSRDYGTVIDTFNSINEVCYSYLNPERQRASVAAGNPEVQHVANYYQHVLEQMPEDHQPAIARQLIAINLYQGLSLYQEQGFREYMGFGNGALEYNEANNDMLDRMRVEKGGIIFSYFWPYFPNIADGIDIPHEPPTIGATIQNFLDGNSIYPVSGVGRRLLEIGGMNQRMDDSCDRDLDRGRGVVSPENWGAAFAERHDESRDAIVARITGDLDALRRPDDDGDHKSVVDAGIEAVRGLTLFRRYRHMSKKENPDLAGSTN